MNNFNFHKLTDQLFLSIEYNIDNYRGKSDIDCEKNYNVITITFENKKRIIINKQEPLHQVWLATHDLGYHFEYKKSQWICNRTQQEFWYVLGKSCSNQTHENIKFSNLNVR
ncbi:MAG: iron donor protein CyaY [Buchnera aphidicola (Kaburagia rhusicola rhusicola)]